MSFQDAVKSKVTATDYERLNEIMQMSPHRLTKIFNDPKIMTAFELQQFAQIMKESPLHLISVYDAGVKSITLAEYYIIKEATVTLSI